MRIKSYFSRFYYIFILWLFAPGLLYAQIEPALSFSPDQDQQQIITISISSDGRWIVTGTNQPILWDAQTGEKIRTFHGHDEFAATSIAPLLSRY